MSSELFEKYKHKIKSLSELMELLAPSDSREKIILCHGVFDVVHPGHIRHLAYAKSLANFLIVSITADRYIVKGTYRPHIPEHLRALNLAAFEMVDYVIVSDHQTPLNLLSDLEPDFFAKGFEYTSSGLPPATIAEEKIVKSYGGEMIFTPGDVVYSSTRFIESALPNVQVAKLSLLMETHEITFSALRMALSSLSEITVHVVGDTIIDTYTRSTLIGGQTKTPTLSVRYEDKDDYVGGAGIVAKHIRATGAKVIFSTVLGNDFLKDHTLRDLKKNKVSVFPVIEKSRPTTNKNVIIANDYRLLKIDTVDNRPISSETLETIVSQISEKKSDMVIFCDFRHGIFNQSSIDSLIDAIPDGTFTAADSQVATRWGNITEFKNFDLVTPNEREARFSVADQDSTIRTLAETIQKQTNGENIILKLGSRGVFCLHKVDETKTFNFSVDSLANNIIDPIGAGDALLAYASLALYKTGSLIIASILGSIAAACECEIDGNTPVKPENVLNKIDMVEKMMSYKIR